MAERFVPRQTKLWRMMRAKGVENRKLAAVLGVGATTMSRWALGKREVPEARRARLAEVLGSTVGELWPAPGQPGSDARIERVCAWLRGGEGQVVVHRLAQVMGGDDEGG